jgi:hypothetical protein
MALRFRDLQELFLHAVYLETMKKGGDFRFSDEFNPLPSLGIANAMSARCIGALLKNEYLENKKPPTQAFSFGTPQADVYEITTLGMEYVENQLGDDDEPNEFQPLGIAAARARDMLLEMSDTNDASSSNIPASGRTVPLDHNSANFQTGVENLEKAIDGLEKDESLSNELGPEKTGLVNVLRGARALLDNYKIGLELYIGTVISPLRRLQEIALEHPGATWGAFVSSALNAFLRLIERV